MARVATALAAVTAILALAGAGLPSRCAGRDALAVDAGGNVTVQEFYDGALKYGADDASCIVPVN